MKPLEWKYRVNDDLREEGGGGGGGDMDIFWNHTICTYVQCAHTFSVNIIINHVCHKIILLPKYYTIRCNIWR